MAPFSPSKDSRLEPLECWICRDVTEEALVNPCRCRGSMRGVHASCVQSWVHAHERERRALGDHTDSDESADTLPRCPVCMAPYGGEHRKPGARALMRAMLLGFIRNVRLSIGEFVRFAFLGFLLVRYQSVARPRQSDRQNDDDGLSVCEDLWIWLKGLASSDLTSRAVDCLMVLLLFLFLAQKLLVVMISMPVPRPPPRVRILRCFHTDSAWQISRHLAELASVVSLLTTSCLLGDLPLRALAPVVLVGVSPAALLFRLYPAQQLRREVSHFFAFMICGPPIIAVELSRLLLRHRRRLRRCTDGALHVFLSLAILLMLLLVPAWAQAQGQSQGQGQGQGAAGAASGLKVLEATLLGHSALLSLGLVDLLLLKRLDWQPGRIWWFAVFIGVEAVNLALRQKAMNLILLLLALRLLQRTAQGGHVQPLLQGPVWWCCLLVFAEALAHLLNPQPSLLRGITRFPLERVAIVWWLLLTMVTCRVNWQGCVASYRGWQRRHATFVLCTSTPSDASNGGAVSRGVDSTEEPADPGV